MTKGEENIVLNERDELIQIIEAQQQMIFEANKQIQAQRQEIDLLIMEITELRESNQALKAYAENIEADKDEQARKTRQLEEGLRSTSKVLETLNYRGGLGLDIHKWLRDEMQTVNALLGGKEDA
jgi:FtsZ-binding cell division protein ZapB